nr:hypothetical protein [Nesterenkonia sp. LY-0111]
MDSVLESVDELFDKNISALLPGAAVSGLEVTRFSDIDCDAAALQTIARFDHHGASQFLLGGYRVCCRGHEPT